MTCPVFVLTASALLVLARAQHTTASSGYEGNNLEHFPTQRRELMGGGGGGGGGRRNNGGGRNRVRVPAEAKAACESKSGGASCSFTYQGGPRRGQTASGTCKGGACTPARASRPPPPPPRNGGRNGGRNGTALVAACVRGCVKTKKANTPECQSFCAARQACVAPCLRSRRASRPVCMKRCTPGARCYAGCVKDKKNEATGCKAHCFKNNSTRTNSNGKRSSLNLSLTVELDIASIKSGSAARTKFEIEFRRDVAAAMKVQTSQIKITSVKAGSVEVSFSVLATANGGQTVSLQQAREAFAKPGVSIAGTQTTAAIKHERRNGGTASGSGGGRGGGGGGGGSQNSGRLAKTCIASCINKAVAGEQCSGASCTQLRQKAAPTCRKQCTQQAQTCYKTCVTNKPDYQTACRKHCAVAGADSGKTEPPAGSVSLSTTSSGGVIPHSHVDDGGENTLMIVIVATVGLVAIASIGAFTLLKSQKKIALSASNAAVGASPIVHGFTVDGAAEAPPPPPRRLPIATAEVVSPPPTFEIEQTSKYSIHQDVEDRP